ncbi:hypothetical protein BV25DRAFT_1922794 [Artomyces pyxidatus]|uniref:Uncharacterized protein n=1 Tax=Artomyces pyxidatus TaxID=48021 RepID=A0ACB8SCP9_9AGAM|nr:hypothetical protein BV25DRAFT_1922794 [Artomyces pyxidatus]
MDGMQSCRFALARWVSASQRPQCARTLSAEQTSARDLDFPNGIAGWLDVRARILELPCTPSPPSEYHPAIVSSARTLAILASLFVHSVLAVLTAGAESLSWLTSSSQNRMDLWEI